MGDSSCLISVCRTRGRLVNSSYKGRSDPPVLSDYLQDEFGQVLAVLGVASLCGLGATPMGPGVSELPSWLVRTPFGALRIKGRRLSWQRWKFLNRVFPLCGWRERRMSWTSSSCRPVVR